MIPLEQSSIRSQQDNNNLLSWGGADTNIGKYYFTKKSLENGIKTKNKQNEQNYSASNGSLLALPFGSDEDGKVEILACNAWPCVWLHINENYKIIRRFLSLFCLAITANLAAQRGVT